MIECYQCKNENNSIHVTHTVAFSRKEDCPITDLTIVSVDPLTNEGRGKIFNELIQVKISSDLNPSLRRTAGGLVVFCELCHEDTMYLSVQHKGIENISIGKILPLISHLIGSIK